MENASGRDVVESLLALTAAHGWRGVSMSLVAEDAGLPLSELLGRYRDKGDILGAFLHRLDQAVLAGGGMSSEQAVRDRLFDVVMRRLDALQPHKTAIQAIVGEGRGDPWLCLGGARALTKSAALMLEAAGVETWGVSGWVRIQGLAAIYLMTLRAWLADDSADMAETMARLDGLLRRAEWGAERLWPDHFDQPPSGGGREGAAPAP